MTDLTTKITFRDERSLWQRIRNKVPPYPARTVYVGLVFNASQGWHQAEASVDVPDGVGRAELVIKSYEDGKLKLFDDFYVVE